MITDNLMIYTWDAGFYRCVYIVCDESLRALIYEHLLWPTTNKEEGGSQVVCMF